MDCPACQERFTAMAERDVGPVTVQARGHLEECPGCRQQFASFERTVGALRDLAMVRPPAHVLPGIYGALDGVRPRRLSLVTIWQPLTAGAAMTACLALIIWSVVLHPAPGLQPLAGPVVTANLPAVAQAAPPAAAPGMGQPLAGRPSEGARGGRGFAGRAMPAGRPRMIAMAPAAARPPTWGNWATEPKPALGTTNPGDGSKPANTFGAGDDPGGQPQTPLVRRPGPMQLSFVPPTERTVGVAVVGELVIDSQAECEVTVLVETQGGLRVANAPEGVLYRGPIRQGQVLRLPVRLVAAKAGTQGLRVKLVPDVATGKADLDISIPDFTGEAALAPGKAIISLKFADTPIEQAAREMATAAGARVVVHDEVAGHLITHDYSAGVPLDAALRILCDAAGCRVEERDGVYHILK